MRFASFILVLGFVAGCAGDTAHLHSPSAPSREAAVLPSESTFTLAIKDFDLQDVLHTYESYSGIHLVQSLGVKEMHTRITVGADRQVTKSEALKLITQAIRDQAGVVFSSIDEKHAAVIIIKM
jgi:hypothetical protein